jgi:glycine cleavage system transcriptional repressor
MTKQMIISVMSQDRPGIIAGITGAIYRLGGDVADLNQTVLCGYLTMILSVSFSEEVTKEDVMAAISHIKTESKFEVSIKELTNGQKAMAGQVPEETYILTVQGPNKAGIVHGVSQLCYERNINILDLATTLKNDQYTMALQLDLKNCTRSRRDLRTDLEEYSKSSGLSITMQHNDIFQVTNEVTLH